MPLISNLAVRSYYRVTVAGARVPSEGPVLLVANHNNSLVDPAFVVVAADRTVRFLAKSTLFGDKLIGWLVKGVGSVPVYRAVDDPTKVVQNLDSFRDVHAALAGGDAVGIFPEGISHSASQLAPLKTGAARMAMGAGHMVGHDFPIVAMGLVFRDRDTFRSEAHAIITEPFRWDDLLARGQEDRDAVRELTRRIESAMRSVTLNLAQWEDEPMVRAAEAVWVAEFGDAATPTSAALSSAQAAAAQIERLRVTTEALAALRTGGDASWRETAVELRAHAKMLRRLGLTPSELKGDVRVGEAIEWTVGRIPLAVVLPVSLVGAVVFLPPKWLTVRAADKMAEAEGPDTMVTHRILIGGIVFPLWFAAVAAAVWPVVGTGWAVATFLLQPFWAFAALAVGERRQHAWAAVRRFFLRRSERPRLEELRARQRAIAERLKALFERVATPS